MCVCVKTEMLHLIKLEGIPFQLKHGGGRGEKKGRDEWMRRRRRTVLK